MRLKPDLQLRKIGSQYMIVDACNGSVNMTKVFELNETAARIWQWIHEQELDADGLAAKLCEEYEVEKEQALKDVTRQLEEWKRLGLVQ